MSLYISRLLRHPLGFSEHKPTHRKTHRGIRVKRGGLQANANGFKIISKPGSDTKQDTQFHTTEYLLLQPTSIIMTSGSLRSFNLACLFYKTKEDIECEDRNVELKLYYPLNKKTLRKYVKLSGFVQVRPIESNILPYLHFQILT